jgi:hypothetical protein
MSSIVRGDDDGRAARIDLAEEVHDFEGQVGVEIAGRLVGQDELRLVDERARDRDALLLATGQFFRIGIHPVLQAHPLQHLERLALLHREVDAEDAHHERDVLEDREARDQAEVLEDESDGAAVALNLRRAEVLEVAAGDLQIAFARQILAQQQPEQGRLAGAAGAGEKEELALVDGQREIAQRVDAAAVELRKMMSFYQLTGQKRCLCTTAVIVAWRTSV